LSSETGVRAVAGSLPTFLVIGAMKSGTTSLHRYLGSHPQIFMSRQKELNFFSDKDNWRRGPSWYERHFADVGEDVIAVGESSTNYSKHPEFPGVPARIANLLPAVRFVYVLRHPVERMISHYRHRLARGKEHRQMDDALLQNPIYVDASRYAMQIGRYLEFFPRERVLLLTSRDLQEDRVNTVRRIWRFLRVDDGVVPRNLDREFHRSDEKRAYRPMVGALRHAKGVDTLALLMPRRLRRGLRSVTTAQGSSPQHVPDGLTERLEELVREDVGRLRSYMGESFDGWGIA
jgi:hypothetical protein